MLSIVTINKNNVAGLKKTLHSLQYLPEIDFEWIFIDSCSNDGSFELATSFQRDQDRLISEPDSGIYDAMNKGARLAQGNKILFLNSGDEIFEGIELDYLPAPDDSHDLLLYGFKIRTQNRLPRPNWWRYWSMPTSHQSIIYSKVLLMSDPFDSKYRYAADFEHYLRVNLKRLKIKKINAILIHNEPYGSDLNLQQVLVEYRQALLMNGMPKLWANLVFYGKKYYLKFVLSK